MNNAAPAPAIPEKDEVFFINAGLQDLSTLLYGLPDGADVVLLDESKDGLQQMAEYLQDRQGLTAIHLLSHGAQGTVQAGSTWLNSANLAEHQAALQSIGAALGEEGDLLLYGCDIAAGDGGAQLLAHLAKATGADIAASTDPTGAANFGGDWTLESHAGAIDARELALTEYDHLLASVDLTTGYEDGIDVFTKVVDGVTVTFTIIPSATDPEQQGFYTSPFPGTMYVYSPQGVDWSSGFIITVPTGYVFDLTSVTGAVAGTVTYSPSSGNIANHTGVYTDNGSGAAVTDTYSLTFKGMTQLAVTSAGDGQGQDGYLFFTSMYLATHTLPTTTVNALTLSADTGNSDSDFLTKTATNGFAGTLSAPLTSTQKVQVSYDGTFWNDATTYATGSSAWSVDTTLAEGTHTIQVRVAESYDGGSTFYGSTAQSQSYTLDTVPSTISFNSIHFSNDDGNSNTDLNTNTGTQDIKATLSAPLDVGDKVWISTTGVNGSYTDVTSFVSSQTLNWTGQNLAGSHTLAFKVTDAAGNDSTPTTQAYIIDTTPPTAYATSVALSVDSGTPGDLVTHTAAQTISGALSANLGANETVYVSIANGAWAAASSTGTAWSLAGATLTGSSSTIRVKVTDLAGNDSATVYSANYTLDTSGPTVTFTNVRFETDSGDSATDFITNESSQTIHATVLGTLDADDLVYGSLDNGNQWHNITAGLSGSTLTWSGLTLSGTSSIKLKVVDNAGNNSTTTYSHTYSIDTAPPAAPTTPTLDPLSDTGVSSSDKVTNDSTPTLTGTAEAGSTVTIYDGASKLGTAVATGGAWSYTSATLSGGSHGFTVTATDTAGNVSTASNALPVTLDTTPPAITSVDVPSDGSYRTGATLSFSVHTDDPVYINSIGGMPRLELTIGATTRYATYASGSGSNTLVFSYVVQAGDNDGDGIALSAFSANGGSVTDVAGNALGTTLNNLASTANVLVDTAAPVNLGLFWPDNGTYYTGTALEFKLNYNEAVTVNTGGGTPSLSIDVGGFTRYASYVSGSGTSDLLFRYTVVNGDTDADGITFTGFALNGGTLYDAAGNLALTPSYSTLTLANILVDGSQPSITNVSAATADGSYGDGATINITVSFSSAVEVNTTDGLPTLALSSGSTASYFSGGGSNTLVFRYTVGAGENSADLDYASVSALALNGATIRDAGGPHQAAALTLPTPGTAGSLGANKAIVIDTIAPTITGSTVLFSNDTGSSATDLITKQAAQNEIRGTLDGTLASNETVMVSLDNGVNWISASAAGSNWSIDARTLVGSNTIKVYVQDSAGNTGSTATFDYVLDQTGPTTTFGSIRFSNDSGISDSDLNTSVAAQTISATLSTAPTAGEKVFASLDGGNDGWSEVTSYVSGTTLTWTGVTLAASNTLQFYVRDVAGNDGTITYKTYVLDTTAPSTSIASIAFSDDSGSSNTDYITNIGTQTISGTLSANLQPGEMVYVSTDDGVSWDVATSDGLDGWSIANRTLTPGNDTLQVKVTDTAGNDATVVSQPYSYDSTAPAAATVTPLTTQSLTPVLSGSATLTPGETLTVSVGGAVYDVTPVAGNWSLDLASAVPVSGTLTLLLNQRYNVAATVTDLAGNSSVDSSNGELMIGVIAPPAPAPAPTLVPVDGVPVTTTPGPGGSTLITVPVITSSRPDTPGSPSTLADIPLVTSSGRSTLLVSLPIGTGLQTDGFSTSLLSHDAALAALIARIEALTGDSSGLIQGAQTFLASLFPGAPLAVQLLTPVAGTGFNPDNALTITGSNAPADGKQAIILDASNLPAGSVVQLNNVDFAAVVGNVTLRGGDGQNFVIGDGASQNIILGADDDIIHGGGGNDTVGSRGGNDQLYGDAGDDIVFGGAGNDLLSGGSGSDKLNGGTGFDVALHEGKRSDYSITLDGAGIKLTHIASGVSDWLVDVEQVRFETGPILTVAHSAAEEAAGFLFQKWMGRDLTQAEGAVIQSLDGLSAVQVADLFAQVFPQQAGGRTAQQLLEGMETAGAIRVDAERATTFVGDEGDNTFAPTLGLAWTVDGGAGIDTLVFPVTLAQTYIDASTTGFTLQRMADGAMLELINVERLTFSDTKLALDLDGHAGQAAKLLGALGGVGLLDNKPLVGEVIRALDAGVSAQSLAQLGLQVLGAHTPGQVTQLLWTNVVGSAPTPAQLQPFVDMMAQGVTGGELAVLASSLDLNATRIDLVGLAATGIEFA